MTRIGTGILILAVLSACTATPIPSSPTITVIQATAPIQSTTTGTQAVGNNQIACSLSPVVVPTMPAAIPGYTQLDPATNLHMTGTAKQIDVISYRLEVTGKVDHPLSLTYDDLRCMNKVTTKTTLICPGYFEDTASWAGAPLVEVLDRAGVQPGARSITSTGADGYSSFLTLDEARSPKNLLAYEWEGQPLPILHGFPVREVLPGQTGGKWVKWLLKIEVE